MRLAELLEILLEGYAVGGLLFAIAFVTRGVNSVDPVAKGSTMGFRAMILPGAAALWPLLLARTLKQEGQQHGKLEQTAPHQEDRA